MFMHFNEDETMDEKKNAMFMKRWWSMTKSWHLPGGSDMKDLPKMHF